MNAVEYDLTGDPQRAKATAIQALESRKFKITWSGDWDAVAQRGNVAANLLFGAFAQYFKVGVTVRSGAQGVSVVRIDKSSSGWTGGWLGASRTKRNFESLHAELESTFRTAGVLSAVRVL
ncbi:MAG TPA: hypothetical protein PLV13_07740 [Ilumatobacteraceae bacterium]|nr:hypothetical protein [Ilumatobacteraceae bacterium]